MVHLLTALRPRQWVKNLLVLGPVLFSRHLFSSAGLSKGLAAFALFCAISSAGYLINDLRDVARDRVHPAKRRRPIASGKLGKSAALVTALALLILGMAGAVILNRGFTLVLGAYCLITL